MVKKENTNPEASKNDPFDPSKFRLSQNFAESIGVKKALLTVLVQRPNRQEFVRVHPDEDMRLQTPVMELKEDRETYLVEAELWPELAGELIQKALFTTINRQGVLSLWPVRLPGEDGRHNEWNRSAFEAAQMAMKTWIRIAANMSLGAYEVYEASANLPDPVWPDLDLQQILRVAFKDRIIQSLDHPVVRRLRGEL